MYAHVDAVTSQRVLQVLAVESFSYAQQREYFRVNVPVKVSCQRVVYGSDNVPEAVMVNTINVSGNGVLLCCDSPLQVNELYELTFFLAGQSPQQCVARVVRVHEKLRSGFEVALQYISIVPEVRDALIAFCLAQQRQALRTKVQISEFN